MDPITTTATVSGLSIFCMFVSLFISLIFPIVIVTILCVKRKIHIAPVLVGAAVFFVFQTLTRIPALTFASEAWPAFKQFTNDPLWGGLFLGLTAGLFEEFGRFIGYKVALKKYTGWNDGFAFGLGHGGFEAITLAGLSFVNNIIFAFAINSGAWDTIAAALPAETAQSLFNSLTGLSPVTFLVGGMERLFAMTIQVALSILVLYAIRRRRFIYVLLAVLLHAVVDSPIIFLITNTGTVGTELYAFACAVAGAIYIVLSRKVFVRMDAQGQPEGAPQGFTTLADGTKPADDDNPLPPIE